ncbi:MAG: M15 family metallopeptidase [Lachnospiraceae bacterium]|nr:M15 family metallopeptidase [Lachnospiraceae bacterium]MDE7009317.1 M15 family metallopeptidase [Lachnospiraceae bacterium]
MDKWLKPLGFLAILILIFSVIARLLSRGETLAEYAEKNPETAYAAPQKTQMPSPSPSPEPAPSPTSAPTASPVPSEALEAYEQPFIPVEEESPESTHYKDGFFYQPLSDAVTARITGLSYPVCESIAPTLSLKAVNVIADTDEPAVSYADLCYMNVQYYDFDGEIQTGELICNKGIAQDLVEIFYELYLNEYRIEKIRLIDEYGGDDTASMEDNNTSCFNYRVVDGTTSLSKHALGCAIDINPFYNPYVVYNKNGSGETYISPKGSERYADRSQNFPYKIDENDLCYKLFTEHGFIWGGNWNSSKDYQHFQKVVE